MQQVKNSTGSLLKCVFASCACLYSLFLSFREVSSLFASSEEVDVSVEVAAGIGLACDADGGGVGSGEVLSLGTITLNGTVENSLNCYVRTNNRDGHDFSWRVPSGSGGVNTGSLISEFEDTIPGFFASKEGLVGHWRMDELSAGSTVIDYSGNGNNGTPNGAGGGNNLPQPSTDIPSTGNFINVRSLDFDGDDDRTTHGNPSILNVGTDSDFTISFWYKPSANSLPSDTTYTLVAKGVGGTAGYGFQYENIGGTHYINISKYAVADQRVAISSLSSSRWHHLVGVQRSGEIEYFINGTSVGTYTNGSAYSASSSYNFTIGSMSNGTFYASGTLDDVRVYNESLSDAEVVTLYVQTQPWSLVSSESQWAARLSSTSDDTDTARWGTDSVDEKWLNVGDGSYTVISRTSPTSDGTGSTLVIDFKAGIGSIKSQPTGTYRSDVEFTASIR